MTTPEYCLDCRAVDPEMTAGGLSSKQMQEIAKQATALKRAETAMLYRAAGQSGYLERLARENERRRALNEARRTARKAA
jgi:hypothetical protein